MQRKRKNKRIKRVAAVSMFIMLLQASGYAAAQDEVFSGTRDAGQLQVSILEQAAATYSPFPDLGGSSSDETGVNSRVLMQENRLNLLLVKWRQIEQTLTKMINLQTSVETPQAYNCMDSHQPLLGFYWGCDKSSLNKWKIVLGPGIYISTYQAWRHAAGDSDIEAKISNRGETDLLEKLKNELKVMCFQIRYKF